MSIYGAIVNNIKHTSTYVTLVHTLKKYVDKWNHMSKTYVGIWNYIVHYDKLIMRSIVSCISTRFLMVWYGELYVSTFGFIMHSFDSIQPYMVLNNMIPYIDIKDFLKLIMKIALLCHRSIFFWLVGKRLNQKQ